MKRSARLAAAIAALGLLAACGSSSPSSSPGPGPSSGVTGVVAFPPAVAVAVTDTVALAAVVLPDPGASQEVTWTTADPGIARIATDLTTFYVRGVASGTTTITATSTQDPTRSATIPVTVFRPPTLHFPAPGSTSFRPGVVMAGTAVLDNLGDAAAPGVTVSVSYVIGLAGWLSAAIPGPAPAEVPSGGSVDVALAADAGGLPSGLYAAVVEPQADPGVIFTGNPYSVTLFVP